MVSNLYAKEPHSYAREGRETWRGSWMSKSVPIITLAEADDMNFLIRERFKELYDLSERRWYLLNLDPCAAIYGGYSHQGEYNWKGYVYPVYPTHLDLTERLKWVYEKKRLYPRDR